MPRTPTGKPRGRPVGSGTLGEQTRITVRIPTTLYDRLEAFAAGRHYHRDTPQLAACIREALEHYLLCPNRRQTKNVPQKELFEEDLHKRHSEYEHYGLPEELGEDKRQTANNPGEQTEQQQEPGDTYVLPQPGAHTPAVPAIQPDAPTRKAMIVPWLHALHAEGKSLSQIAAQLETEGVPTLSGKGRWQKGTVGKLLKVQ